MSDLVADLAALLKMTVSPAGHTYMLTQEERYGACRRTVLGGNPPEFKTDCTKHCAEVRAALARAEAYMAHEQPRQAELWT